MNFWKHKSHHVTFTPKIFQRLPIVLRTTCMLFSIVHQGFRDWASASSPTQLILLTLSSTLPFCLASHFFSSTLFPFQGFSLITYGYNSLPQIFSWMAPYHHFQWGFSWSPSINSTLCLSHSLSHILVSFVAVMYNYLKLSYLFICLLLYYLFLLTRLWTPGK